MREKVKKLGINWQSGLLPLISLICNTVPAEGIKIMCWGTDE